MQLTCFEFPITDGPTLMCVHEGTTGFDPTGQLAAAPLTVRQFVAFPTGSMVLKLKGSKDFVCDLTQRASYSRPSHVRSRTISTIGLPNPHYTIPDSGRVATAHTEAFRRRVSGFF